VWITCCNGVFSCFAFLVLGVTLMILFVIFLALVILTSALIFAYYYIAVQEVSYIQVSVFFGIQNIYLAQEIEESPH
jgi:hypothetical protein